MRIFMTTKVLNGNMFESFINDFGFGYGGNDYDSFVEYDQNNNGHRFTGIIYEYYGNGV